MFGPCVECDDDTSGKRRIRITFFEQSGDQEWLPIWFCYKCLKNLRPKLEQYLQHNKPTNENKITCASCGWDTYRKRRVLLSISDTSGQLENYHVYFDYECLLGLWNFESYNIWNVTLQNKEGVFRRP